MARVPVQPLTRHSFRPYGDVVEIGDSRHYTINQGLAERYADMAKLDLLEEDGAPNVGIVRAKPRQFPLQVKLMERHPKSSQLFIPLVARPFLVLVAPPARSTGKHHRFQDHGGAGHQLRPRRVASSADRPRPKYGFPGRGPACQG